MRWRIRSAAPVHRHSLPQLLADGLLVALAYYLAYWLRFDGGIVARYDDLLKDTILWVVPATLCVLAAFGVYQRLWTFVGQRDYEAVIKAAFVATVIVVGAIALVHPVVWSSNRTADASPVTMPASVISLWFLLMLVLLGGARFVVHLVVEGRRPRWPPGCQGACA